MLKLDGWKENDQSWNYMIVVETVLLILLDSNFHNPSVYFDTILSKNRVVGKGMVRIIFLSDCVLLDSRTSASPMNSRKLFITSPEKEDRYYTTRGSVGLDENGKMLGLDHHGHAVEDKGSNVWPKLFLSLSSKEKEEDFLAMKGCKLPQRPKKRGKLLQKSLHVSCP